MYTQGYNKDITLGGGGRDANNNFVKIMDPVSVSTLLVKYQIADMTFVVMIPAMENLLV